MTDNAKASVWTAVWAPWGNVYSITGTATLDARFPGQWYQLESGLHYNWYRHYDPTLGCYTQPDPLGFVDGPSVYGYARSGPQAYVDPDGKQVATPVPVPQIAIPGALVALYCQVYPDECRKLVEQCVALFKEIVGGGGSGGEKKKREEREDCEAQDAADRACCMSTVRIQHRAKCHGQATARTAACMRGEQVPPLGWCGR